MGPFEIHLFEDMRNHVDQYTFLSCPVKRWEENMRP